ncbi:N-acetyl sugar amidotransferase [Xanthomarina gelatinilytica]|uniref:N-acetyl sugar amidotransferase n=1 Tax=Xanthomarina gelatinilytica TaxID=1137281 RepID=UPI003AA7EFB6
MKKENCKRCLMNTGMSDVKVFNDGTCSSCRQYFSEIKRVKPAYYDSLESLLASIRKNKSKKYDCIVGVSGGVDSSYTLVKAIELGLKPLAVHMDNGWNSELANSNIKNLCNKLDVDLYTHVIDWDEYRELMNCFFKADVVDVELLYDNAMIAVNYNLARKFKINHILAGTNHSTEGIPMPSEWNWFKFDKRNIKSIVKFYNGPKLKTMPTFGVINYILDTYLRKIKWIDFLDHIDYKKSIALEELVKNYNYKPYEYKHYESVFTRFYQGYILPNKFGIDKRIVHLSAEVLNGDLTRDEAVQILSKSPYSSEENLNLDKKYFLKKMKWKESDLTNYLSRKKRNHDEFKSEKKLWNNLVRIYSYRKK